MPADNSWIDRVAESATQAGRNAWLGLEASAIIASSPAGIVEDSALVTDPLGQAAVTALNASHEALSEAVQGRAQADEVAEETDVIHEQNTELIVDPPSWLESMGDADDEGADLDDDGAGFV